MAHGGPRWPGLSRLLLQRPCMLALTTLLLPQILPHLRHVSRCLISYETEVRPSLAFTAPSVLLRTCSPLAGNTHFLLCLLTLLGAEQVAPKLAASHLQLSPGAFCLCARLTLASPWGMSDPNTQPVQIRLIM